MVNTNIDTGNISTEEDVLDKKKSGNHLILRIRHTFQGDKHKVLMEVAKLERE